MSCDARSGPALIYTQGAPTLLHAESPVGAETAPARRESKSNTIQRLTMKTGVSRKEGENESRAANKAGG
jgi:hypothetical protein